VRLLDPRQLESGANLGIRPHARDTAGRVPVNSTHAEYDARAANWTARAVHDTGIAYVAIQEAAGIGSVERESSGCQEPLSLPFGRPPKERGCRQWSRL